MRGRRRRRKKGEGRGEVRLFMASKLVRIFHPIDEEEEEEE